jgi:hypothetical protein
MLLAIASVHDVVDGARIFHSHRARHDGHCAQPAANRQATIKATTKSQTTTFSTNLWIAPFRFSCDKVGDVGTFEQKLKALEDDGYVSKRNREVLDAALDAGNATAHRGHQFNSDQSIK